MDYEQIIKQVLHNPQVTPPPISYTITDHDCTGDDYKSQFIDIADFNDYLARLEAQLLYRLQMPGSKT